MDAKKSHAKGRRRIPRRGRDAEPEGAERPVPSAPPRPGPPLPAPPPRPAGPRPVQAPDRAPKK